MSLKITDLKKRYGDKVIFDGFCYDFPDAGILLIRGTSGVGKTTLLRIISGLDKDYTGEIVGGGFDNVSVSFQEYRLFPTLNAIDNTLVGIENPTEKDRQKAASLLLRMGYTEDELAFMPSELSGGMKQRVSLARAFMKDCPVYLLDEATKELDSELVRAVLDIIKEYSLLHLVILVTHNDSDGDYLGGAIIEL